jgi:ATP-dependent exoDNAse (exonuclease V) alpha subunit
VSIATYGYVITAHKSQGSQWEKVFVHQDAFRSNPRWLYTAATRAEKELTLTMESSPCKWTWEQIMKAANHAFKE